MGQTLASRNGSLLQALAVWKRSIDLEFDGVEACPVCYYVLHGVTKQLPRKACPTCRNKFHSACLAQWFKSSRDVKCPMCRTPMQSQGHRPGGLDPRGDEEW